MSEVEMIIVGYFIVVAGFILSGLFVVFSDMFYELWQQWAKYQKRKEDKRREDKRRKDL
jgi:hypothetical protein